MSKPVTGVAMMMLYEEGKWQINDPVSRYIPEFSKLKVYTGKNEDGSPKLEDARRSMTMRELMTQIVRRGHEDGTIRADVTAWTVVRFGSMLAQPMPTGPEDPNAAEQRRIFLRGISV